MASTRVANPLFTLFCILLAGQAVVGFRQRTSVDLVPKSESSVLEIGGNSSDASLVKVSGNASTTWKNQPLVYNKCSMPLAVYLERGFLFNKQVIQPGEAVQLWSPEKGPFFAPFNIIAVVGDESALPSDFDSMLHFIGKAAVPTAFVGGVAISVISWGALTGPAVALGPLVSNAPMVLGYTLGAVDIAAGAAAAKVAKDTGDYIVKKHPEAFMAKAKWVFPGTHYFEIVGGPSPDSQVPLPLTVQEINEYTYKSYNCETVKVCQALSTRGEIGSTAFSIEDCGNPQVNGKWRVGPDHNGKPTYVPLLDADLVIQWSYKRQVWRITTVTDWYVYSRPTYYESAVGSDTMPDHGWKVVAGSEGAPSIKLSVAFTIKNCGDKRLNGAWALAGKHNERPQYMIINGDDDDEVVMQYSWKRGVWRVTTTSGWWRTTLYSSENDAHDVPHSGWKVVDGASPAPELKFKVQ